MTEARFTLITRPFQVFLKAADDLLKLAKPHFDQIQDNHKMYERTGRIVPLNQGVWQMEKSLSISTFILKYVALEAFVNCVHEDLAVRKLAELPESYFVGILKEIRQDIIGKPFRKLHLATRVFMLVPLCIDQPSPPSLIFDVSSSNWKKFEEIIDIRKSFIHAKSEKVEHVAIKKADKIWEANNSQLQNLWPITNVHRDHRNFNYTSAVGLLSVINWVLDSLIAALGTKINDDYMKSETARVHSPLHRAGDILELS